MQVARQRVEHYAPGSPKTEAARRTSPVSRLPSWRTSNGVVGRQDTNRAGEMRCSVPEFVTIRATNSVKIVRLCHGS